MKRRQLVAIDCDGILSDFLQGALYAIKDVTGVSVPASAITQWDPWKQLGLSETQTKDVRKLISEPGFAEGLYPHYGAVSGMKALRGVADVLVVTSPWIESETWVAERYRWLWQWMDIPAEDVFHGSKKQHIAADIFVDDKPEHVLKWRALRGAGGYVWDAPYNRECVDVPRIFGWDALLKLVEGPRDAATA